MKSARRMRAREAFGAPPFVTLRWWSARTSCASRRINKVGGPRSACQAAGEEYTLLGQ